MSKTVAMKKRKTPESAGMRSAGKWERTRSEQTEESLHWSWKAMANECGERCPTQVGGRWRADF